MQYGTTGAVNAAAKMNLASGVPTDKKALSILKRIDIAIDQMQSANCRVGAFSDKILGSYPEPCSPDNEAQNPSLVGLFEQRLGLLEDQIRRLHNHLDNLETFA